MLETNIRLLFPWLGKTKTK